MKKSGFSIWWIRIPIFIVLFFNVQCALFFLLAPHRYAPSFDLSGEPGKLVVQALAILFLMWNVPYVIALVHPLNHLTSLVEAFAMQFIGGLGETLLFFSINPESTQVRTSIARFMLFDWSGLILLMVALLLTLLVRKREIVRTANV